MLARLTACLLAFATPALAASPPAVAVTIGSPLLASRAARRGRVEGPAGVGPATPLGSASDMG